MPPLLLKISGMHCAGCATSVQRAIESRPGVQSASVSLADGLATIEGEDLATDELIRAVQGRGFEARAIDQAEPAALRSEIELEQAMHERRWRRRAIIGLGVWIPLELLHWLAPHAWHGWMPWVMLAGATLVLVTAGAGFYASAWSAAKRRTSNMDTLIAMGATMAYVFSLVVFIARLAGVATEQPLYFAESAALLGIISLGHWIEARASAQAGSAVRELLELQPEQAEVLDERGEPQQRASAELRPGDRVLIRPGGRLPVDGIVVEGETHLDESVVTGESMPVRRGPGDRVVAGAINTTGRLVVEASVDGRSTTIARIAEIVQRAQASKASIQRLADRVSSIFVPTVLSIAALTLVGWTIAGEPATGVIAAVTVLIISCPCALGLATPMAIMVGAGAASRHGILVKSAGAFERAGRAQRVVFDKTGTLTAGRPVVGAVEPEDPSVSVEELLRIAAAAEAPSEHPIAQAIVADARERGIAIEPVHDFEALPGEGVRARLDGRLIEVRRDERATCFVSVEGRRLGTIDVADALRPDAADAVRELRAMGLEVLMLSGDRAEIARAIGGELGLDAGAVHGEATPQSKESFIAAQAPGTVMVGDGINDAAALARADIGIAMASGTTVAIESADVVIPGDHVRAVPQTLRIARQTLRTIRQNLFLAFLYNAAAIPAAALGLLGPYGPLIAAAAMGASDITVIGNALRLKRRLRKP